MPRPEILNVPPVEAIERFRSKGYHVGFDWQDTDAVKHARSFTAAKVMKLDILADLREAVDEAIAKGQTFDHFRNRLEPLLKKKGWWGRQRMTDPVTGESRIVQLGSPHRLRTIFDTNIRMSYAQGRWKRIEELKEQMPYLRYVSVQDIRTRPDHAAWHGTVLPVDHPFWQTHYPPNGWRCRCIVQQLDEDDLERYGYEVSPDPKIRTRELINKRTGEVQRVPFGIDPGFAHNVGQVSRQFDAAALRELPVLEPVRTFRDEGRLPMLKIRNRPKAPERSPLLSDLTERGLTPAAARKEIEAIYREIFGIAEDAAEATLRDPEGLEVMFNLGLLRYMLSKDNGREAFLPFVRPTVEDPYEIWLMPYRKRNGRVVLRKRYIGLFEEDAKSQLVVVERYREGWGAWSTYPAKNIDTQRRGYLLYGK